MDKKTWNALTPNKRAAAIRKCDSTMRLPRWEQLVKNMAACDFDGLTPIQQNMITTMLPRKGAP